MSSDVVQNEQAPVDPWTQLPITDLIAGADTVLGHGLEDKANLIGVSHIITKVVFRPTPDKQARDYVSVEATVYTKEADGTITRGEDVVYNDGSTGVRRQIMEYLTAKGFRDDADPDARVTVPLKTPSDEGMSVEYDIRLNAPRGLRVSNYVNDFTQEGETFYLA